MCTIKPEPNTPPSGQLSCSDDSPSTTAGPGGFNSDFQRLSIKLNMGEHPAYLQQLHDGLPVDSSSSEDNRSTLSPVAVAFSSQDFGAAYATVANYHNYSLTFEPSLPTPVGSPSVEEDCKMDHHPFSHNSTGSQQPTPPGTSRPHAAEWFNHHPHHHQMTVPSQVSSPMALQSHGTAAGLMDIQGLDEAHSPHQISGPEQNYWGSYGVSGPDPQEELSPELASHAMFMNTPNVVPSALMKNHNMIPIAPAPPSQQQQQQQRIPLLSRPPHPGQLGSVVSQVENLHHPFPSLNNQPPVMFDMHPSTYSSSRRPAKPRTQRAQRKRNRPASKATSSNQNNNNNNNSGSNNNSPRASSARAISPRNSISKGPPDNLPPPEPLELVDKAPEGLKELLRLRHEHEPAKGKDMWGNIAKELNMGKDEDDLDAKAKLQMRLTRGVLVHAKWPEYEVEALKKAWEYVEKNRHKEILRVMEEKFGGCRAWKWKKGNIVKKLHELNLEDVDVHDKDRKTRRQTMAKRNQQKMARRQSQQINLWPQQQQQQLGQSSANMATMTNIYEDETSNNLDFDPHPKWTLEHDNEIFEKYMGEMTPDPELDEAMTAVAAQQQQQQQHRPSVGSACGDLDTTQTTSERVARQACDQMIAKQAMDNAGRYYGGRPQ